MDGTYFPEGSCLIHSFIHSANLFWVLSVCQAWNQRKNVRHGPSPLGTYRLVRTATAVKCLYCLPCARHYAKQITFYNNHHSTSILVLFDRWGNQGSEMVKQHSPGHRANKLPTWVLNPHLIDSKSTPLSTSLHHFLLLKLFLGNREKWGQLW